MLLDAHERLNAAGVSLQSATEPLDTSQPIGRFLMHLLASMAELEHGTIVERTNLVRGRAAQEGRWGGGLPPYGYRVTGEKHDRRLVVYKPEAGVVRHIFVLYTGGLGLGLGPLANLLNAEGVPAPYAGRNDLKTPRRWRGMPRWNHGVLSRILRPQPTLGATSTGGCRSWSWRRAPARALWMMPPTMRPSACYGSASITPVPGGMCACGPGRWRRRVGGYPGLPPGARPGAGAGAPAVVGGGMHRGRRSAGG